VLDLGGIRVVHAWWHQPHVDLVAAHYAGRNRMDDDVLHAAYDESSALWAAMEGLTKGQEVTLPNGHAFEDHAGVKRSEVRTKWWREDARSFRDVAIVPDGQSHAVPDHPLPDHYIHADQHGAPVFVGHYWFNGAPVVQSSKVACLDWSAAKDGPLVAYRWDGETELSNGNFVEAGARVGERTKNCGLAHLTGYYNLLFRPPPGLSVDRAEKGIPILAALRRLDPGAIAVRHVDEKILNQGEVFEGGQTDLLFMVTTGGKDVVVDAALGIDDFNGKRHCLQQAVAAFPQSFAHGGFFGVAERFDSLRPLMRRCHAARGRRTIETARPTFLVASQ
jgi:hypothetical protein